MNCPTLAHIARTRSAGAVNLTTTAGRRFTVLKAERVIFAPDLALLTASGQAYHVPPHLFEEVRAAFDLRPAWEVEA